MLGRGVFTNLSSSVVMRGFERRAARRQARRDARQERQSERGSRGFNRQMNRSMRQKNRQGFLANLAPQVLDKLAPSTTTGLGGGGGDYDPDTGKKDEKGKEEAGMNPMLMVGLVAVGLMMLKKK